jgi:hypothetical protein
MADPTKTPTTVQGEGDYVSARKFQTEETAFAKSGKVEAKAREAADAVDGPEGAELEAARKASAEGHSLKPDKAPKP